jgi:Dyp-type peroxidase family
MTMLAHERIQGLALFSYASQRVACYLHVAFSDPASCPNAWLGELAEEVATADERGGDGRVNVAFTVPGLARLGLTDDELSTFPRELRHGMGHELRARVLGDEGENAPGLWQFGAPHLPVIHALVALFARTEEGLAAMREGQLRRLAAYGGALVHEDRARVEDHEPFGFRDGIEQPHVEGSRHPRPSHAVAVPAGEFLLGHRNAYGDVAPSPRGRGGFPLGIDGSYLVYRKLAQDVSGFWSTMLDRAVPRGDARAAIALASRIVGRWPSGAPLAQHPDRDVGDTFVRSFEFAGDDPEGHRCPLGAHIRRANPRDMLGPSPEASRKAVARHRILRRGRVYGPPTPGTVAERARPSPGERGLIFIAMNASVRRQFEFIQQTWLNNPKFAGLYDERDPLAATSAGGRHLTIQGEPARTRVRDLPSFVTVRGGGYFFLPSRPALGWLARLSPSK